MTHDEHKALTEVLCPGCASIIRLLHIPVRLALRWCLCDLHEAIDEGAREPLGFKAKAKKA